MKLRALDYIPVLSSMNGLIRVLNLAHVQAVRGIAERHLYVDKASPVWTRMGRAIVTLIPGINLTTALYDFVFYILGTPKPAKIAPKGTGTSKPLSPDSVEMQQNRRSRTAGEMARLESAPPETECDARARASVNDLMDALSAGQVESGSRSSRAVPPTPRSSVASEEREPLFHEITLDRLSSQMKELSINTLEAMCELLLCVRSRFLASCEERGDWTQLMQSLGCQSVDELVHFYWTRDPEVAVKIGESNGRYSELRYLYYVKNNQWLKALQVLPKHDDTTIAFLLGKVSGDETCPLEFRREAAIRLSYYYSALGLSKEADTWLRRAFLLGEDVSVLDLLLANASDKILRIALEGAQKSVSNFSLHGNVVVPYLLTAFDEVELEGQELSDALSKPWPRFKYAPSKRAVDRMVALYNEKLKTTKDHALEALIRARIEMISGLETYDAQCEAHSRAKTITEREACYMYRVTPPDERGLGGMRKKDYYAYVAIALGSDSVPLHYAYTLMSKLSPQLKAAALERVKARYYQSDAICLAALMEEQGWGGKQIPLPGTPKTLGIVNEFVSPHVVRILHEVYGETLPHCFSGIRREMLTDLSFFATSARSQTRASLPNIEAMLDVTDRSLAEAVANSDPSCDEYLNGFYEKGVSLLVQHYEEKGQFEEVARLRAITVSELMKYYKKYDHLNALRMCQKDRQRQKTLEAIFWDESTSEQVRARVALVLSRVIPEKAYAWMVHAYRLGSLEVSFLALLAAVPKAQNGSIAETDALQLRTLAEYRKKEDPSSAGFYVAYASGTITDALHPSTMMRDEVKKLAEAAGKADVAELVSQLKTHDDICREILADAQAPDAKKRQAARDLFDITLAYIHNARSTEGGDADHWGYLARLYGDKTIPLHHCVRHAYTHQEKLPQVRAWLEEEKESNPSAAYLFAMMCDLGLGRDKVPEDPFVGLTGAVHLEVKEILLSLYPQGSTRHKQMKTLPTTAYMIEALI